MLYDNEQLVLKELGMSSWRNLSRDKFMKLLSIMNDMSDEVRLKIIEQIPQFAKLCIEALNTAKEAYQKTLNENKQTTMEIIKKIDNIRETFSKELNRDNLSDEERMFIYKQLAEIANIYNGMDERSKKFFDTIFGKLLMGLGLIVGSVIVFVGGKFLLSSNGD
ncbi:MAG: hypothetical protein FWD71_12820 [Oscillospiraceae bacterium]|nr:hypothetical protein [Oscillospiraceae bacterium]